jgi:hypothetical protein
MLYNTFNNYYILYWVDNYIIEYSNKVILDIKNKKNMRYYKIIYIIKLFILYKDLLHNINNYVFK